MFQCFGGGTRVPTAVKRQAVELLHKMRRCEEEKTLIKNDIKNTLSYFEEYYNFLKSSLHPPVALCRITAIQLEMSAITRFIKELHLSVPTVPVSDVEDSYSWCSDMQSDSSDSPDEDS